MTVQEAAAFLGCTPRHIRTLITSGRIRARPVEKKGKSGMPYFSYSVSRKSVEAYAGKVHRGFPRGAKRNGPRGKMEGS